MYISISAETIGVLVFAIVVGGLVTGFLAGLLGIGGGGIVAPVLYEVFGVLGIDPALRMHMAVGTSLAVMVPTTLRSFAAHKQRGGVDMVAFKRLAPPVLIGVVLGAAIASHAPGTILKWIWVAFAIVMSIKLAFGRDDWRLGDDLPRNPLVELFGVFVGVVSTLLSIGGGAFVTTMLTLFGRTIQRAVGTSAGIGTLIAIPGAIGLAWAGWGEPGLPPFSLGYVSLIGAALMIPTSVFAAPYGARLAHGVSRRCCRLSASDFSSASYGDVAFGKSG
jgi:uncharacterized membrane protein YfcA